MNLFKNFIFAVMSIAFTLIAILFVYVIYGIIVNTTIAAYLSMTLFIIMFFIFAKINEMMIIKKIIKK